MKSLTALWQVVLQEMGHLCSTSTTLDLKKFESRIEHEGLSFLTITLPRFGSDLQKGLDQARVDRSLFTGFQFRGGLPLFLGGFLDLVFDRGTGRLLDNPSIDSIWAMRQLTLMFAKIALPCSEERVKRAIDGYIECEKEVRESDRSMTSGLLAEFRRLSILMFGDVFAEVDRQIYYQEVIPKHGPGKTADKLLGNKKFSQKEWTTRLEGIFPYGEYAIPNWRFTYLLDPVTFLEPGKERPVRVVTVPKTLKTPRIIAIEPTCMQYMQQAILEPLVRELERSKVRDMIGFSDQSPNQRMASEGSRDENLATLDMSEASDRVSNQHVRALLDRFPHLHEAVDATRSRKADVPGHGVIRLAKFASMGSALCFPFEAMVFLTVVMIGIQQSHRRRFTLKDIQSFKGRVRIYGDDIIIPVDTVPCVIESLEAFGLKVNIDKSYWNGKFRESCGKDYYDGTDVTVIRCRRVLPTRRSDVPEIISLVSLRNQLYYAGLWETTAYLDDKIKRLLPHYPVVADTSPALGRHSFLGYDTQRLSAELHKPMVKAYVVKSTPPRSPATGEGALLKWFLKRSDEPFADRNHLERQGRPDAVYTKLRWVPSY